jgi:hypothetical protein
MPVLHNQLLLLQVVALLKRVHFPIIRRFLHNALIFYAVCDLDLLPFFFSFGKSLFAITII